MRIARRAFSNFRSGGVGADGPGFRPRGNFRGNDATSSRSVAPKVRRSAEERVEDHRRGVETGAKISTQVEQWSPKWRQESGHQIAYKFKLQTKQTFDGQKKGQQYVDFVGNRFPTLETAENMHVMTKKGFDHVTPYAFPLKVPADRRLHPYFREYIWFMRTLDPVRFSVERISERYSLKPTTIERIVKEFSWRNWLEQETQLTNYKKKQLGKDRMVMDRKEREFDKIAFH